MGIIGALISLAGFIVTVILILKTRKSAEAAKDAAKEAQNILNKNVMLADMATCIEIIQQVKAFLLSNRYDAASIRLQEFQSKLSELRHLDKTENPMPKEAFQAIFSNVFIINNELEAKIRDPNYAIDVERTNRTLSKITVRLQDWLGKGKYHLTKGA